MKVVHLSSKLTVTFGFLDDEGNVTNKTPVELETEVLSEESYMALYERVVDVRAQAQQRLDEMMQQPEQEEKPAGDG